MKWWTELLFPVDVMQERSDHTDRTMRLEGGETGMIQVNGFKERQFDGFVRR